jgi:Zinc finger, C2H2 type
VIDIVNYNSQTAMPAKEKFCSCCLLVQTQVDSPLQSMADEKFGDDGDKPTSLISAYLVVNYNLDEKAVASRDQFICSLCIVQLKNAFDFRKLRGNSTNNCYCCSVSADESRAPFLDMRKENFIDSGEASFSYEKCYLDVSNEPIRNVQLDEPLLACEVCVIQLENAFLFRKLCNEAWNAIQKQTKSSKTTVKKLFKCAKRSCNKSYKVIEFLEIHKKTHNTKVKPRKLIGCEECPMKFAEQRFYLAHFQAIHEKKLFKCKFKSCLRKYLNPINLRRHVRDDHETEHKCKKCPKTFSTNQFLQCHIRSVHENNPYVCKICKKKYEHPRSLSIHEKTVHLGMRFKCKKCPKSYSKQIQLDHHTLASHENKPYTCAKCGETYQSKSGVRTQ